MSSWDCPYCGRISTQKAMQIEEIGKAFRAATKYGPLYHGAYIHVCPNPDCAEYTVFSYVAKAKIVNGFLQESDDILETWHNKPQAVLKVLPDYIPKSIAEDYNEAALIKTLSPKASATLSRRCLQGMIRDFWGVKEKNLFLEIQSIKDKVAGDTWAAIDAVRSIGNIGAHMEKDIDVIIDVLPEEAGLLIQLIETLINDWYIERETRRIRTQAIIDAANQKKAAKQN